MRPTALDEAAEAGEAQPSARERRLTIWAGILVAVVVCISLGTPLIGTRVLFGTDMLQSFAPWNDQAAPGFRPHNPFEGDKVNSIMPMRAAFRRGVLSGHYPLWTPLASGGVALGTVPNFGALSPLNLPYVVLPLWYAPAVTKLLELAVAAGFTFLFLRRLGLGRPASLVGGLVFMNSGFVAAWTNWPQAQVGALIPALFWAVERSIQVRTVRSFAPVSIAAAVMIFAGFPAVTLMALGAAGLYALVRILSLRDADPRSRVVLLAGLGAAIVLAAGITALQLLPFREQLGSLDQGYRAQAPQSHIPLRSLVTLAIPNAFGSPVDYNYFGDRHIPRVGYELPNYWEIQSFVGASALVLVLAAATRVRRRSELVRGARAYLWIGVVIAVILIYLGGAPLGALQHLVPFFRTNFIGRLRSVFGFFLAALAAIGLEGLSRSDDPERDSRVRQVVVWGAAGMTGLVGVGVVWKLAGQVGQRRYVAAHSVIPLVAGGLTVAAILLAGRVRRFGQRPVLWVAPLMIGIESLAFVVPYWPRTPKALFYPTTPAHTFLESHLGDERLAAARTALMPGTTTYYGLRSATSHAFQDPDWLALLEVANGRSVGRTVYPHLRANDAVADSPALDRMGVKYFVTTPESPVFGRRVKAAAATGTVDLRPDSPLSQGIPSAPIRAVGVMVAPGTPPLAPETRLVAEVLGSSGQTLTGGSVLLRRRPKSGPLFIPVAEIAAQDGAGLMTVRISLRADAGSLVLASDAVGRPSLSTVVAGDDRLRLVFVRGVLIYQRLDALPRIRWAGTSEVIEDPSQRLFVLSAHVAPDVVVLDEPGPTGSGKGATLGVSADAGDDIRATVSAAGDGYLVVADSLQKGWKASVDGRPARLFPAEHAMAAVFVPSGRHQVRLSYEPKSWRDGLLISVFSLVVLIAAFALPLPGVRRRA